MQAVLDCEFHHLADARLVEDFERVGRQNFCFGSIAIDAFQIALQKFSFRAAILDEAQFIKNPGAQVTQSVKQLKSECRLALTGTPLENRLLDLWSIVVYSGAQW